MKYGGVLIKPSETQPQSYSYCEACELVYQDNVYTIGSVHCPNCKTNAVVRGLNRSQAREKLDDEHKELLS